MTDTPEIIEGVATEGGAELALRSPSMSLMPAANPADFVVRTSEIATALADVIEQKKLYKQIGPKKFIYVEGWTLLGSMMGAFGSAVFAVEDWTRPYYDPETEQMIGWEARVVAKTIDGNEVGAAEAMCTRKESKWRTADDYAIRSMAQTRATSKALRQPLGFIVQLAGYSATPSEEIEEDRPATTKPAAAAPAPTLDKAELLAKVEKGIELLTGVPGWTLAEVCATASSLWARPIEKLEDLEPDELQEIAASMRKHGKIDL